MAPQSVESVYTPASVLILALSNWAKAPIISVRKRFRAVKTVFIPFRLPGWTNGSRNGLETVTVASISLRICAIHKFVQDGPAGGLCEPIWKLLISLRA
jgi:hypothetical protein